MELEQNLRDVAQKERRAKTEKDRRDREAKAERDRLNREEAAEELRQWDAKMQEPVTSGKALADEMKASRERQKHRIDRAVSGFMPQIGDDLSAAVARRTASGESPEDIAAALTPQVEAHLRQYRTPDALSGPAAEALVAKVMERVDARLAGIGGDPRAAAAQLAASAQLAGQRDDARQGAQAMEGRIAEQLRGMGHGQGQVLGLSHRMANLIQGGLSVQQSYTQAIAELHGRVARYENMQARILNKLNFTRQRAGMERGTVINRRSR